MPLGATVLTAVLRIQLSKAEELLAGSALLIGALLGGFAMVAGWRERLLQRDRQVDQVAIRSLDEAAAHTLFSTVLAAFATGIFGFLANFAPADHARWLDLTLDGLAIGLSAIGVGVFVYILLTVVIVSNLLWDGYQRSGKRPTPGI